MKVTLSAAVAQLESTLDLLDPETGELPEGYESARNLVLNKAEAVTAYLLQSKMYAEMAAARSKELAAQAKTIEKRAEWLRRYLLENMQHSGITEIRANDGSFVVKRYPERDSSVEVFDEKQIPSDYTREIPPVAASYVPDKGLIAKAIKDGFDVPGAKIIKRDRLTIQ